MTMICNWKKTQRHMIKTGRYCNAKRHSGSRQTPEDLSMQSAPEDLQTDIDLQRDDDLLPKDRQLSFDTNRWLHLGHDDKQRGLMVEHIVASLRPRRPGALSQDIDHRST